MDTQQARHDAQNFIGLEPQAPGAKRKVGGLTVRTLYLDKAILDALQKAGGSPIQQVVLLGSGMDSRAWRLDLPAGTRHALWASGCDIKTGSKFSNPTDLICRHVMATRRPTMLGWDWQSALHALSRLARGSRAKSFKYLCRWFEVDQEDVQRAKRGILRKAGAALSASEAAKVPLKVAEWHSMVANLLHQGWAQRLQQEGFDPSHPTLWLAEGLFNYLEPAGLKTMLSEAAQVLKVAVGRFYAVLDVASWTSWSTAQQPCMSKAGTLVCCFQLCACIANCFCLLLDHAPPSMMSTQVPFIFTAMIFSKTTAGFGTWERALMRQYKSGILGCCKRGM